MLLLPKIVDFVNIWKIFFIFLNSYFSDIYKINNFRQQKQQVLISSNKTPKVLLCWLMLLGASPYVLETQKLKNGNFLIILKNPKMSNFSTIFENRLWAPHMFPWQRLKWYYQLATYSRGASSQKFLSKFLPPALWDTQLLFVAPIFFTFW